MWVLSSSLLCLPSPSLLWVWIWACLKAILWICLYLSVPFCVCLGLSVSSKGLLFFLSVHSTGSVMEEKWRCYRNINIVLKGIKSLSPTDPRWPRQQNSTTNITVSQVITTCHIQYLWWKRLISTYLVFAVNDMHVNTNSASGAWKSTSRLWWCITLGCIHWLHWKSKTNKVNNYIVLWRVG